ncbi:EAL domain-containing protein [Gammaproteobacteria bacterium LSUCC0112]|nr:EAL domain-containing protein [Gammaproteobacteria bacterium LSUCC0112]
MNSNGNTLSNLIDKAGSVSKSPVNDFLDLMLKILRKHLGMEVAFVSRVANGRREMRVIDTELESLALRAGHSDALDETYCQLIIQGKIPQLIHNATDMPEVGHIAATHTLPVGALISVPLLLDDGSVYGTLCCFSTKPDDSLSSRDLNLVQAFAEVARERISGETKENDTAMFLTQRLNRLLADRLFHTVYQPIVDLAQRRLIGYEALTRFDMEPIRPPDKWFAEARRIAKEIDLEIACINSAVQFIPFLGEDCYLSINASPEVLVTQEFHKIIALVQKDKLVIEITEHAIIDSYEHLTEVINILREQGIRIAVDDAGAGYASFKHILALKPDIIKLDMSLVRNIDTDFHKNALARGLMSFATAIGCRVIAEGVETEEELVALKNIGVNKAQGYLLGSPQKYVRD